MVMMWWRWLELMASMMLASVVDLPDPVGPVTRISPLGLSMNVSTDLGKPRALSGLVSCGIMRSAPATLPRERKKFARKRLAPFHRKERSTSLVSSNCFFCFSLSTL